MLAEIGLELGCVSELTVLDLHLRAEVMDHGVYYDQNAKDTCDHKLVASIPTVEAE
jgi:hypothetical protein